MTYRRWVPRSDWYGAAFAGYVILWFAQLLIRRPQGKGGDVPTIVVPLVAFVVLVTMLLCVLTIALILSKRALRSEIECDPEGVRLVTQAPPLLRRARKLARTMSSDPAFRDDPERSFAWAHVRRVRLEDGPGNRSLVVELAEETLRLPLDTADFGRIADEGALFAEFRRRGIGIELPPSPMTQRGRGRAPSTR